MFSFVGSGQSSSKIEELLQEDYNVKRRRERAQKQSSLLSKLTRQLSVHDNRAAAASSWSDEGSAVGNFSCKLSGGAFLDYMRIIVDNFMVIFIPLSSFFFQ